MYGGGNVWGIVLNWGLGMGMGGPQQNKQDRSALLHTADNVVSLRHRGDEFFDLLSPLLEEAANSPDDESPRQGNHNVLSLRKENARLPALAVNLSNLVPDLPGRYGAHAVASCAAPPSLLCTQV